MMMLDEPAVSDVSRYIVSGSSWLNATGLVESGPGSMVIVYYYYYFAGGVWWLWWNVLRGGGRRRELGGAGRESSGKRN